MTIDWKQILDLIPVVAGVINPAAGVTLGVIIAEADKIIASKQAANPGLTRDQIIAEAQGQWEKDIAAAEALAKEGH